MDSTQRISERGRPLYLTANQSKVNQTTEAVVSVSEDRSVQGEQRDKVGGVAADRKPNLQRFRELLGGRSLPNMTQLMSGQQVEEESVARKALEKPELKEVSSSQQETAEQTAKAGEDKQGEAKGSEKTDRKTSEKKSTSGKQLTEDEQKEVEKLKARDREVRTHEQAHVAAGGQYVRGGINYEFQRGPDGRNYAVGGHVNIDVSEAETPEATVVKMQQVKRAALAPAEPSGADRAVAAAAAQKEQQARSEMLEERQKEVAESRSKVAKEGQASNQNDDTQQADGTRSTVESSSSIETRDYSEAPDVPTVQNHMNLAREARMRIKRGEYWMG
jgi:hypothetical protein